MVLHTYRALSRPTTRSRGCMSTRTPAIRTPGPTIRFRAGRRLSTTLDRHQSARVTWQATPRNKFNLSGRAGHLSARPGMAAAPRRRRPKQAAAPGIDASRLIRAHLVVAVTSRLLLEAGWARSWRGIAIRAADRRHLQPAHDPHAVEQSGVDPEPDLPDARGVGGGFNHHQIGHDGEHPRVPLVCDRRAQHEVRLSGRIQNPTRPTSTSTRSSRPVEQRRAEPVHAGHHDDRLAGRHQDHAEPLADSFYAQDQWTRSRLTLQGGVRYDHTGTNYPDRRSAARGYTRRRAEIVYPSRSTQGLSWDDITPRMGAAYDLFGNGKTAIKFNLGKYMQAFIGGQQRPRSEPDLRTAISTTRSWTDTNKNYSPNCDLRTRRRTANADAMANQNLGKNVFSRTFDPVSSTGWGNRPVQLGVGRVGPAGTHAPGLDDRRLLPQLVGQLVCGRQPGEQSAGLDAVQHHGAGRCAAAQWRRPRDQRSVQPRPGQGRAG